MRKVDSPAMAVVGIGLVLDVAYNHTGCILKGCRRVWLTERPRISRSSRAGWRRSQDTA